MVTVNEILRFDVHGSVNEVICSVCKKHIQIPSQFPVNQITDGKRVVYKTRNAFLKRLSYEHHKAHFFKPPPPVAPKFDTYKILIDTYYQGQSVHIFEQNLYCNEIPEMEVFIEWKEPDRLLACIINLGLACKWFEDSSIKSGIVEIRSDQDGLDQRYDGEQDVLFHLLFPESGWQAKKNAGLYSEYDKYLKRIRQLQYKHFLKIKLNTSFGGGAL